MELLRGLKKVQRVRLRKFGGKVGIRGLEAGGF